MRSENLIPVMLELGGKSPNIFFADVMAEDDAFFDKALEGFTMFALNQGEVCTCPSRALVQNSIYDRFMEKAVARVKKIKQGNRSSSTMIGAQASNDQLEKILSYVDIGKKEGAKLLDRRRAHAQTASSRRATTCSPPCSRATTRRASSRRRFSDPCSRSRTFDDEEEALSIANDTLYGLGAGIWTRDMNRAYRLGRGLQAGRAWTNCYHLYPAHAAFGGYKKSGSGVRTTR